MRWILLLLASVSWLQAQPAVSEIKFKVPVVGIYPHGEPITYTGTFQSFTVGSGGSFGCGYDVGPEPNTVWLRITGGLIQGNSYLFPGEYTGCVGTKIRIGGQDYPITVKVQVVEAAAVTTTNNAGVPDTSLPHCTNAFDNVPRWYIRPTCQEANRRPGGTFNMPPVGGSYTDSFGTKVRVLTTGDGSYYAAISPFNADESLVMLQTGIFRVSDGLKLYNYRPDNTNGAQCWFELVPGYQNTMTCMEGNIPAYGGQGRILRYTLPSTCTTPPCTIGPGLEMYRVSSPYNFLTKGSSTGATSDGWAVWSESFLPDISYRRTGVWRVCAANLAVPVGEVKPICIEDLDATAKITAADYINLAKAPDADGRRYIMMMSDSPMAGMLSFLPGDSSLTWHGFGPVRSDYPGNTRLRPKCEVGVERPDHCVATPHADIVMSEGQSYLVGDGTPQIPYGAWITSFRLSAGNSAPNAYKDWMRAEEVGGGVQFVAHQGGYVGCAALAAMCVTTNYGTYVPRKDIAAGSVCDGTTCTINTTNDHGWAAGQPILIGLNNLGITPGTTATVTEVPSPSTIRFASTFVGSGNYGFMAPNNFVDTLESDEINVIRKFGPNGVQIHRLADVRTVIYFGYDDLPKPAISPSGRYVVWGANNGIPGMAYALLADVGLGSPRASEQFTGPNDGVTAIAGTNQIQFNLIVPDETKSCLVRVSQYRDLTGAGSQFLNVPAPSTARSITATGLTPNTQHWWRVQCGINVAAGTVNTLP